MSRPPKPVRSVPRFRSEDKARWGRRAGDELREARMAEYAAQWEAHRKWADSLGIGEKAEEIISRNAANRLNGRSDAQRQEE